MKLLRLLAIIPVVLLTGCSIDDYTYDEEGYVKLDSDSLELDDITSLDVDWINGDISIGYSSLDVLNVRESDSDYPLYYKITDHNLSIKLAKNGMPSRIINKIDKTLSIALPPTFDKLTVNAVNTYVSVYSYTKINTGVFNLVDGSFNSYIYAAKETVIDAVNNPFYFSFVDTIMENSTVLDHNMKISAVSSNITMGISLDNGYEVDWTAVDCHFVAPYQNEKSLGEKKLKIAYNGVRSNLVLNVFDDYAYMENY